MWLTGGKDDVHDIFLNLLVHIYVAHHAPCPDDILGGYHLVGLGQTCACEVEAHDVPLLLLLGVGDFGFEHKPVDLRLGQRIGTLLLDGVLGCQHKEWLGQTECLVANGYLPLLHSLQECALHLCGRTVNLVGQHKVGEDGAFFHCELLALLGVDEGAHKVGGQQVRGKLYAAELGIHSFCEGGDGKCFCQTGNTFEEDVSARKEANQQ